MKKLKIFILLFITFVIASVNVKAYNIDNSAGNWQDWQKEEYWEWHTRTTTNDAAYNGKHIVIQNNVIDFYGYWQNSYKDFLYKEYNKPGKKIFQFRIDEANANYHTLDGAGFIFNSKKSNDKLSGYVLLFKQSSVDLYQLKDVDINTFETASSKVVANYGKLIKSIAKTNSKMHDLIVEATPINIKVNEAGNEILNVDLDYSEHEGESFGLISSYVQHSCSILSKIEFSQLEIALEDYNVKVKNTDTENNPLTGGYFEIKDENGKVVSEGSTDKDGVINIIGLTAGNYTIQQKKAPDGYILNDKVYKFKVEADGKVIDSETNKETELIIKNEKKKEENNSAEDDFNDSTSNPSNSVKKDNTVSDKAIPNAGNKIVGIVTFILFLGIIIAILIFEFKKYKDVK